MKPYGYAGLAALIDLQIQLGSHTRQWGLHSRASNVLWTAAMHLKS